MSSTAPSRRRTARVALLFGAAILAGPALAADRPATAEGAKAVQAVFDRFLPAPTAEAPPFVSVKVDGESYVVSVDLADVNGALKAAGADASYEPAALVYRLFEQDDGKWRVVQEAFPKIVSHVRDATSVVDIVTYRQTFVIDPALAWFTSGAASADKGNMTVKAANLDETFDFGPLKADLATTVDSTRSVSSSVKETIDAIAFKVAGTVKDGRPVNVSGRMDRAAFSVGVDRLKSKTLFDLVALLSAHRADLAEHEVELKDLLRPLAAPGLRFAEGGEASKLLIESPIGAIALSEARFAVGVSNNGPESAVDATVGAEGLSLPVGLLPPGAADLTPSKINLTATVNGFDIAAAADTAIDNLHLASGGPAISPSDSAKVSAALIGGRRIKVALAPSHVVAPAVDADLQGDLTYAAGKASGAVTVRMRGFDKTMNAVKALGPEIALKALPALAMAKGLAKTETDGALSWLIELGDDRSIKVNGLPLGKAPE